MAHQNWDFACKFKGPGRSNVSGMKQNKTFGRNTGVQFWLH
jgi:hypothetical protein